MFGIKDGDYFTLPVYKKEDSYIFPMNLFENRLEQFSKIVNNHTKTHTFRR